MALTSDQAARLSRLQTAYDNLISGAAVAEVEYAGQRTLYAKADLPRLRREIDELNALAAVVDPRRARGAIRFRL
jgi:predicted transcriptional regulator